MQTLMFQILIIAGCSVSSPDDVTTETYRVEARTAQEAGRLGRKIWLDATQEAEEPCNASLTVVVVQP